MGSGLPGTFLPVLMLRADCSLFALKPAQLFALITNVVLNSRGYFMLKVYAKYASAA
jgi:hypothetical protein